MTGGWAATNTLREALTRWPTASDDQNLAALALVEAALDAAERVEQGGTGPGLHDRLYALAAALRAVREGK